jgi:N-formylglutamate amidohydrolase
MYSFGRGIYYTKKDNGKILRKENSKHKNFVIEEFYTKHHEKLNNLIQHKLNKYGECIIVDCHSFSNKPFQTDLIQDENRPDVCIGIDNFHTPENLKTIFVNLFKEYSVLINNPYSGTIIPEKYYKDSRVKSIMIELNRNLYMVDDKFIDTKKLILLNRLISSFFNFY